MVGPGLSPESQRWSLSRVVLDTLVSKESRRGRCGAGIQGREDGALDQGGGRRDDK